MNRKTVELDGDNCRGAGERIRYLASNFMKNLSFTGKVVPVRHWRAPASLTGTPANNSTSPARLLAETFLKETCDQLMGQRAPVRVLDVGCGSGRCAALLASAGLRGAYVGVDVDDSRFDSRHGTSHFERSFIKQDIHLLPGLEPFNLVVSNSALEHIPDDQSVVPGLMRQLADGGAQVHIVPAPAALFAYLWHGYRQYTLKSIQTRFQGAGLQVWALGGVASLIVHMAYITVPGLIFRSDLRKVFPTSFSFFRRRAYTLDTLLPFLPLFYGVVVRRNGHE